MGPGILELSVDVHGGAQPQHLLLCPADGTSAEQAPGPPQRDIEMPQLAPIISVTLRGSKVQLCTPLSQANQTASQRTVVSCMAATL